MNSGLPSVYDVNIDIFKGMKDDEIKMTSVYMASFDSGR
jgi:hypothetical protein